MTEWPTGKDLDLLVLWAVAHSQEGAEGDYPGGLAIVVDLKLGGDGMFISEHKERLVWRSVGRLRDRGLITAEDGRGYVIGPPKPPETSS